MFHALENSDEEPDFTCPADTERYNEAEADEVALEKTDDVVRIPRKYSPEELNPGVRDLSCKPDWPLAFFWPVYVGNFKVEQLNEEAWYDQISNYFAYRGLLTRMIFVHQEQISEKFHKYQRYCELMDMLVYFTSKQDAERAIATCHRDSYYGYKINVLPGRTPVFFDNTRSVRFVNLGIHSPVECTIANSLSEHGPVRFIARYPDSDVVVEFVTSQAMIAGLRAQKSWKPVPLTEPTMKQRFLEKDASMLIQWVMESQPGFMDQQPKPGVLMQLFEGVRPNVPTPWQGHTYPVKTATLRNYRAQEGRRKKMLAARARKKAKLKKYGVVLPQDPPCPSQTAAKQPKKTKRQTEAANVRAANRILQQHGAKPISKSTVVQNQKKVFETKKVK